MKTDQAGFVNVKVQNNTYNLNFPDTQSVELFKTTTITPNFEEDVKEKVFKQLEPSSGAPSTLSEPVSGGIVVTSTMTTAIDKINEDNSLGYAMMNFENITFMRKEWKLFYLQREVEGLACLGIAG